MINIHPETNHLSKYGFPEEGSRDNYWAEEEKANHVATAAEKSGRAAKADQRCEGLFWVEQAEAAPLTICREVYEVVGVDHGEDDVEVEVAQQRLGEEKCENWESLDQEAIEKEEKRGAYRTRDTNSVVPPLRNFAIRTLGYWIV